MVQPESFRVTSIEPLDVVAADISDVAISHGLSLEAAEPSDYSAPFCGNQYFSQEFRLVQQVDGSRTIDLVACWEEIEQVLKRELADGFMDPIH